MPNQTNDRTPIYLPAQGQPLGTNSTWRVGAGFVIPLLKIISKPTWRGVENIPQSGPMIAICNHISYVDPLIFAHFLYGNGRAVRFLGKASLFRIPVIGWVLRSAEQVPVEREVKGSSSVVLSHAVAFLEAGHCLGIYPEGTLTLDEHHWPMVAKTGLARIAVLTKVPVIPCAQWGAMEILPPHSKFPKLWPRTKVTVIAGKPLDFSPWYGKEEDHAAMVEATAYAMSAVTHLLEEARGELAPDKVFDPSQSKLLRNEDSKGSKNRKNK